MDGGWEDGERLVKLVIGCLQGGIRVTLPKSDPEGCSKTIHKISGLRLETVLSKLTSGGSVPEAVSA